MKYTWMNGRNLLDSSTYEHKDIHNLMLLISDYSSRLKALVVRRVWGLIMIISLITSQASATMPNLESPPETDPVRPDLNLRFSNRPITLPDKLVVQIIPLSGFRVANSMVAPSPQAVIFENDQRQRIAILSHDAATHLTLFLLEPLSLDPTLPGLLQCVNRRACQHDRTPITGGLGCVALCLKEILEMALTSPIRP